MDNKNFQYTPKEMAKSLIDLIDIRNSDKLLEPFKGTGSFFSQFPQSNEMDWCELEEEKDFFTYTTPCDVIITNPPFHLFIKSLEHSMTLASRVIGFLFSHRYFNSLTPLRLKKYEEAGWRVKRVHICQAKKWIGRYFFVVFEKNADDNCVFSFDTKTYID